MHTKLLHTSTDRSTRMLSQRFVPYILLLLVIALCLPGLAWAQGGTLTLRINDMQAEPGGLVAIVVRTYASRPITL